MPALSLRRPSLPQLDQGRCVEAAHLVRHIVLLLVHSGVEQLVEALLRLARPDPARAVGSVH